MGAAIAEAMDMPVEIRIVPIRRQWDFITCPADMMLFGGARRRQDDRLAPRLLVPRDGARPERARHHVRRENAKPPVAAFVYIGDAPARKTCLGCVAKITFELYSERMKNALTMPQPEIIGVRRNADGRIVLLSADGRSFVVVTNCDPFLRRERIELHPHDTPGIEPPFSPFRCAATRMAD